MNHIKMINDYLKERGSLKGLSASGLPFVTISRMAGAGGHLLAYAIQSEFMKEKDHNLFGGWHVFDRELCQIIAADPSLNASMEALLTEEHRSEFREFVDGLFTGRAQQYSVNKKTFQIVRALASLGKVIIVGHAGAFATRDLPAGLHIRLVAPETNRTRWMMKKLKIDRDDALALLHKQDADKAALVREYFDKDIADPLLYDAVWNSGSVDLHDICHSVIDLVKRRAKAAARPG